MGQRLNKYDDSEQTATAANGAAILAAANASANASANANAAAAAAAANVNNINSNNQSNQDESASIGDDRTRDLLLRTWNTDFDQLFDIGTEIYEEIFRLDPTVKRLFPALDAHDLNTCSLRECKAFKNQALRFVQTVSMAVQNCAHLQQIDRYLRDIGRRHVQYKERGFRPQHWQLFQTAIGNVMVRRNNLDQSLDEEEKLLLEQAWKQMSKHVIQTMTAGFV